MSLWKLHCKILDDLWWSVENDYSSRCYWILLMFGTMPYIKMTLWHLEEESWILICSSCSLSSFNPLKPTLFNFPQLICCILLLESSTSHHMVIRIYSHLKLISIEIHYCQCLSICFLQIQLPAISFFWKQQDIEKLIIRSIKSVNAFVRCILTMGDNVQRIFDIIKNQRRNFRIYR